MQTRILETKHVWHKNKFQPEPRIPRVDNNSWRVPAYLDGQEPEISIMRSSKCQWCGKEFLKSHNREVYCSSRCRYYGNLEKTMFRMRKYRKFLLETYGYDATYGLGEGNLGSHRRDDFDSELRAIKKEMSRIGIDQS